MSKFGNLKKFDVDATKSVPYEMSDIEMGGKTPIIYARPATEANKPFAKAQLKSSNKRLKTAAIRGVSLELMTANRNDDRQLYPEYVITGWENVIDQDGMDVPFSKESCIEFLEALPDWVFDGLRQYCTSPMNFPGAGGDEETVGN